MTTNNRAFINHMAMINALGHEHSDILNKLQSGDCSGMVSFHSSIMDKDFLAGVVSDPLPAITGELACHNTRNNQLLLHCLEQMNEPLKSLKATFDSQRIGVVMGTSTSGIAEGEQALINHMNKNEFPSSFDYSQIQMSSPAEFLADYVGLDGPCYSISTACSSSGKVFASAKSLIDNDICDAVIVGGADSICDMTLNGFDSLEAVSPHHSQPFSANRNGINIGEGAALFIISKEYADIELLSVGESSDAHHISAPHPEGQGAAQAMLNALKQSGLSASDIDYLNLHGTGTMLNDAMESKAVISTLTSETPCSSTKPLTGHTLGAAGATELGFCWLLAQSTDAYSAKHLYDGVYDPSIPAINLVTDKTAKHPINVAMSNSFAFGGNNVSVIIGRSKR